FLALTLAATPLLFGAVASAQYRLARVITFLNPGSAPSEATWQVHQSLVGIGAGRLFGVGLGQGQQKLGYLPYAYSDFTFSTIGGGSRRAGACGCGLRIRHCRWEPAVANPRARLSISN